MHTIFDIKFSPSCISARCSKWRVYLEGCFSTKSPCVKIAFAGRRRRLEMPWHLNMLLFPYLRVLHFNAPCSVSPKKVTKMHAYNAHHREAFLLILNEGLELRIKRKDITTPWKFQIYKSYKALWPLSVECRLTVTGWQVFFPIQILLIFCGHCKRYTWDTRLNIYRLLNFYMIVQFLRKLLRFQTELFSCWQKVDHVTNYYKRPIFYRLFNCPITINV